MIRPVVIDKSYLDGRSSSEIRSLCVGGALMTDTLFSELLTTKIKSRTRCFAKFPHGPNPIVMIPSVGVLLRYEMRERRPCTPLADRSPSTRFEFHEGLADSTYKFSDRERQTISEVTTEIGARVAMYREAAATLKEWFPKIRGYKANGPSAPIEKAMLSVAGDRERVRDLYGRITAGMRDMFPAGAVPDLPAFDPVPPTEIDEDWLWFRNLQAQLLAALEYFRKNGASYAGPPSKAMEHDLLDAEYVALGALSGALASLDGTPRRFFQLLKPDGVLIP